MREKVLSFERIRVNNHGKSFPFLAKRQVWHTVKKWLAKKKPFRIIIDYDPEWSTLIYFRDSTFEEETMLESIRPPREYMDKVKGNE